MGRDAETCRYRGDRLAGSPGVFYCRAFGAATPAVPIGLAVCAACDAYRPARPRPDRPAAGHLARAWFGHGNTEQPASGP